MPPKDGIVPPLSPRAIHELLAHRPRVPLACLPTPLQEAKRLREVLGGPRIFVKRDDLTGVAFGGNKSRNLEFRMVGPLEAGADVILMSLEVTSNSALQTTAAANKLGMRTILVLKGQPPEPIQGNVLVDYLLGAEVHFAPDEADQRAAIERLTERERAAGYRPMVLTSEPIFDIGSALAYLESTVETIEQLDAAGASPDFLYMASGGKGQAGLVLAQRLLGATFRVHGITVSHEYDVGPRTARIANDTLDLLGVDVRIEPSDVISFADFVGPAYGHVTDESLEAMALLARTEGIILDPVYTGKAFAGLLAHVRSGLIPSDATVVFVHTGGTPAVFTHARRILDAVRPAGPTASVGSGVAGPTA